jgi:hypothetical protein
MVPEMESKMNAEIRELNEEEVVAVAGGEVTKCYDGKEMITTNFQIGDKVVVISATSNWHSAKILKV